MGPGRSFFLRGWGYTEPMRESDWARDAKMTTVWARNSWAIGGTNVPLFIVFDYRDPNFDCSMQINTWPRFVRGDEPLVYIVEEYDW